MYEKLRAISQRQDIFQMTRYVMALVIYGGGSPTPFGLQAHDHGHSEWSRKLTGSGVIVKNYKKNLESEDTVVTWKY